MDDSSLSPLARVSPPVIPQGSVSSENAVIRLDTVVPKPLTWVWYPRIPAGRLSLLVGHPDRGKSLLACTFTAHVTCPKGWPDGQSCEVGNVVFLESEDALDETIVPRLQVAGANLARVFTHPHRNLVALTRLIQDLSPKLVILSPLNTYLPRINTWVDQEVRRVLQPLADLASATGSAILGLMHPPKAKQALPIHAIVGSVAFGAVARSILAVEKGEDGLYLMEGLKQNLAIRTPPIGYRIQPAPSMPEIAQLIWQPVPDVISLIPPNDDQSALEEACEYLRMALATGSLATNVLKEKAERNGIAWRTIMRARKLLRVHAEKVCSGKDSHWVLSLPPRMPNS